MPPNLDATGAAPVLHIWFNRTYATNVHIIKLLRSNPAGETLRVYGTHADLYSPVLAACDFIEAEPEADVTGGAYLAWALDFCLRHDIDVFIPRMNLHTVTAARETFAQHGVAVVAPPARAAALLEDKAAAYEDATAAGLLVPPHRVVRSGEELLSAFAQFSEDGSEVCLKPVCGVGGEGFRILKRGRPSYADIMGQLTPHLPVQDAAAAVDEQNATGERAAPLLLMPLMPGPEVSVDCLADADGHLLAAIPRTKIGRRRLLVNDPAAVEVARRIVTRHRLASVSNTQVMYWQRPGVDAASRPYLLETNARMSAGLYQTALSGLNLPWAAVELALGRRIRLPAPDLGAAYTTVSSLVGLPAPAQSMSRSLASGRMGSCRS